MVDGHAIDIPVTNLDEDDDDFSTPEEEELNANVFRDDFDLEQDTSLFDNGPSLATRLRDAVNKVAGRGYNRLPRNIATNGIELQENFNDRDSFDLNDDEFILHKKDGFWKTSAKGIKKVLIHLLVIGLIIAVIVLGVLLSRKSRNSEPTRNNKQTFFNGTDIFYPTTILISLDGFHPHYISSKLTPTLHEFLQKGYGPPYMIPSFPSSTFPNHWTMATGLHPQFHGIVGNTFFDPVTGKNFINKLPQHSLDPGFWGGEPIWSTAESQGVRSAIHMYPGSEVEFKSWNPSEVDKFNKSETLEVKTNRIFEWLDRDSSKRPELIIAYVPTIDTLGHTYGIQGDELSKGLLFVDSFIKNITSGIAERNATDIINLVVVSDHGMAPTSNKRLVYLDDLINTTQVQHTDGWPLFGLRPIPEVSVEDIYKELNDSYKENSGYSFYLREDLPKEWNFGGPERSQYYDRIAPIWVIPDVGYSITTHDRMEENHGDYSPKGVHGYNNTEVLMRAIFLGTGPYFKSRSKNDESFKVRPFQNIEVYNILCETLGLSPSENNGTANIFGHDNVLSNDWRDDLAYPNVKFDIGKVLKEKSTYDQLFRGEKAKSTTTLENSNAQVNDESTSTSDLKEKTYTTKAVGESKSKENHKTKTKGEKTKSKEKGDKKTKTEASDKSKETKHKGFFESIGEDLEELGDDIKEGFEDIADDIEDTFEDAYHKIKGEHKDHDDD